MQIVVNHWPCGWVLSITARGQEQVVIRLRTLRVIQEQVNSFTLSQNGQLLSYVLPKSFVEIWIDGLCLEPGEWRPLRGTRDRCTGIQTGAILFGSTITFMHAQVSSLLEPRIWALQ